MAAGPIRSVARMTPGTDRKSIEPAYGRAVLDADIPHGRAGWACSNAGHELIERDRRALCHDPDRTVRLVRDPARQGEVAGGAPDEPPEPDALDVAPDDGLEPSGPVRRHGGAWATGARARRGRARARRSIPAADLSRRSARGTPSRRRRRRGR